MKCRLLNLLSMLSLVLCLAVAALWARSFWQYDVVAGEAGGVVALAASYRGHLACSAARKRDYPPDPTGDSRRFMYETGEASDATPFWDDLRTHMAWWFSMFGYAPAWGTSPPLRVLILPHWFPVILTATLPARWLWRRWRGRRAARAGTCRCCGYDLRATPGRCPECGTPATVSLTP